MNASGTLVAEAVQHLYANGALTRPDAERMLPCWRWCGDLSAAERRAVLDRFDPVPWPASLHERRKPPAEVYRT